MNSMYASNTLQDLLSAFSRWALGIAFLSAVADRFGLWGVYGTKHVAWGDFARFINYTHFLTSVFPYSVSVVLAWTATAAEITFGILLLVGFRVRMTAFLSGTLLFLFGFSMTIASGVKAPLDASVFSAAAAAWLLSCRKPDRFAVDSLTNHRKAV